MEELISINYIIDKRWWFMNKIIEVLKLIKDYGILINKYKVLKEVDLEIIEGEFISIMGFLGFGKIIFLNIMLIIDKVILGKIIIDGKDVNSLKEDELVKFRRDVIGFVF